MMKLFAEPIVNKIQKITDGASNNINLVLIDATAEINAKRVMGTSIQNASWNVHLNTKTTNSPSSFSC